MYAGASGGPGSILLPGQDDGVEAYHSAGAVAGTKVFSGPPHAPDVFSDAEWQSEERSRYLAEFASDLKAARGRLSAFDPATPLPPSACVLEELAR